MLVHDIIDNRKEILVDHINRILSSTEAARFGGRFDEVGLVGIRSRRHHLAREAPSPAAVFHSPVASC